MDITTNQPQAGFLKVWTVSGLQIEKEALGNVKKLPSYVRGDYTNRAAGQVRSCAPSSFKQHLTHPCVPTLGHNLPPAQLQLQYTSQHTSGLTKLHFGPAANVSVGTAIALHAFAST